MTEPSLDDESATDKPLQLIILCGLQASGKTTFYRTYFAQTHLQISKDLFPNNKNRTRRQAQLLEEALKAGSSIVVDNTNATRAERAELVAMGRQYEAEVICYYFPPDLKQNLERNRQRDNKARVPDIAIYATRKRFRASRV